MTDVSTALRDAAAQLSSAGVETARLDARLLLSECLGREVWPHETVPLSDSDLAAFRSLLDRRAAREPTARILGRRSFWSLELELGPDTLVPRPDSETLVEAAIEFFKDRPDPSRILDLGTGSGCLLLAALTEFPDTIGIGVDLAASAIDVARRNAERNELEARSEFVIGNWSDLNLEPADLILCNPPYIPTDVCETLEPEVAGHDPRLALDGGASGLIAYRAVSLVIQRTLRDGGLAVVELGAGQAESVEAIAAEAGLLTVGRRSDLSGVERALILSRSSQ